MGRDDLKSKAEPGGFIEYGPEQLAKVDSMRRDKSQPDLMGIPILHDEDAMYRRASEIGDKPASCYTCTMMKDDTCSLLGPGVSTKKVTGSRESGDPIEYWPFCKRFTYGTPAGKYAEKFENPNTIGLIWINASKPGQKFGGANCGGGNGGDDCDNYIVKGKVEKWDAEQGHCRVLAHTVNNGDLCTAWRDDDILQWEEAQNLLKGSKDTVETMGKRKFVRSIMGRDD